DEPPSPASLLPLDSQAVLDRLRRVGFATGMSDPENQKLFASEPQADRQAEQQSKVAGTAADLREGSIEGGSLDRWPADDGNCVRSATDSAEQPAIGLKKLGGSLRHSKPRMSLLGKPINLKSARQDARYRRLQARVYNFLERPKTWQSITYHVIVFASVFICLVFSVLSTMSNCVRDAALKPSLTAPGQPTGAPGACSKFAFKYSEVASEILFYMETGMLFWFFTEYCLRMWSAGCRSRYQTWRGRLLFARRPFCIVDSIVIVASIIVLALGSDRQMFAASALRGLRFFQILRMIRMDRRGGSWKLLASVVWAHRQELFTTVYIGFLGLIFSSFVMYLIEKDEQDTQISNYADALWWGVVTLCTVGYGDVTPKTWSGKIVASFCSIAGISFFALPAGILGSGFALKVQQHQRQKHLIRRRVPAATLIQSLWRCYAADPSSTSMATWKPHMRPLRSPSSKFGRLSTIKRNKSERTHASGSYTPIRRNAMPDLDPANPQAAAEVAFAVGKSHVSLAMTEAAATSAANLEQQPSLTSIAHDEEETPMKLTEVHKTAIRVIRRIKYFVARKKFREALRPYDVKDVIEQYSAGHVDMLARIKVLQFRLDQILGRQGSKDKDAYESKVSLASRIVKVERSMEDVERKLELLIDMYKEDRRAAFPKKISPVPVGPPKSPPPDGGNDGGGAATATQNSTGSADSDAREFSSSREFPRSAPHRRSLRSRRSVLRHEQASAPGLPAHKLVRNFSDLGPRQPKRVTYHHPPDTALPAVAGRTTAVCEAQVHNDFATTPSAPSPPPPPLKSLIDFDDDEDDEECAGKAEDTDEDDVFCNTPPAPPPPPPPPLPLRSALKPMRSCPPVPAATPRPLAAPNRHSFTNRALQDDSEDDGEDQESRRLLAAPMPATAPGPPGNFPATSSRKLSEASSAAAVAATQPALMRPELTGKLRKKKALY
ncbi:hypothetical protein BOX15_Mlig000995g2, partial [Macrostomum lignano]